MDERALLAWIDAHYRAMPPVAALQPAPARFEGDALHLAAPLAANVNDKGCAFGGSLVSLMTLAGWALATRRLDEAGFKADVYVADSQVRYLAPLLSGLEAEAWLEEGDWEAFVATYRQRGRARCRIAARVRLPDGGDATVFSGRFVALRPG